CVAHRVLPAPGSFGARTYAPSPAGLGSRAFRWRRRRSIGAGSHGTGSPVSWIRAADEERERRPADAARCAIGVLGLAAAGLWADAGNDATARLVVFFNGLPNAF